MKTFITSFFSLFLLAAVASAVDPATLYRNTIPADKNLDPAWVQSLTERGHELDVGITGSKADDSLKYIGMPVSGIATGTVYLNGDGRLFVWDIWSEGHIGVLPNTIPLPEGFPPFRKNKNVTVVAGATFMNPPTPEAYPPSFSQGFGLRFQDGSLKQFEAADWESVEFTGNWPVATVSYADSRSPVTAKLKAYSPFVPLNLDASSIPVTVMSYTVSNISSSSVEVELVGWLENMSNQTGADKSGTYSESAQLTTLSHDCAMKTAPIKRRKKQIFPAFDHSGTMALSYLGAAKPSMVNQVPGLSTTVSLLPGQSREFTFLISWNFPVVRIKDSYGTKTIAHQNEYSSRFDDAKAVADYVANNFASLSGQTEQWVKTWYDSTLPKWLLDRTILTADTLQTANCNILADGNGGRFWAWEGIRVCHGTCTHVWHYAQAMARLFPSLERNLREKTDFTLAQLPDGSVPYRITIDAGDRGSGIAIDGQAGTVLRSYREHLISADDTFLRNNWPEIKLALEYLINFDRNDGNFDGLLDGDQHNTLDASWYGKVHALSSLYIAAVRAGEEMAKRVRDREFETLCHDLYRKGSQSIETLYNGEYYIHEEDPDHPEAIGVGTGVYIDQVIGQFWANQLGLGRLYREDHIQSALNALWKYNFVPDVKSFRETFRKGRFYAWDGDAGLIMCSWPNGGLKDDFMNHWQYDYFNENMSGFEYQAAAHMIAEGTPELIQHGLAIARSIHDRYRATARNPYNEIECSDHYARAMASYAVFLAASGFDYDGPAGAIGFNPVVHSENFRSAFTAAEGWGSFSQVLTQNEMKAELAVNWGSLKLNSISLNPQHVRGSQVDVMLDGQIVTAELQKIASGVAIEFSEPISISTGQILSLTIR
jgi:uncharacterized protein (DUF608 family)